MTPAEYNAEMARYCEALNGWGVARVEREILVRGKECQSLDAAWVESFARFAKHPGHNTLDAEAAREQYRLACRRLAKLKEK